MMRLDQESNLVVDAADQRVKYINREIDHRLAAGALQMRMAMGGLGGGCRQSQVIHSRRAPDMGVDDQTQLTERGKCAVDRRAVDTWSGRFRAGNDLIGSEVLFRAIKNFDDRSARPGHPLMLIPERIQRHLDTGRLRHTHTRAPQLHEPILLRM